MMLSTTSPKKQIPSNPMFYQRRQNFKFQRQLQIGLALALALAFVAQACADDQKTGKHLFILSGQSNMTGTVKGAFAARVAKHFGKENVVVVMRQK
ncbi:hypothetical protein BSZ32_03330 [Rubritalea profundi]|uniref:Sialate O-acetylesterase domain-containing protein n=2 Tax=Rubritalea profundi TaxID=1658618 RepID=A0A2S7TZX2_9BACT|nr:hypothetical protein BSZ32_03330 [Rubritalea profundi]